MQRFCYPSREGHKRPLRVLSSLAIPPTWWWVQHICPTNRPPVATPNSLYCVASSTARPSLPASTSIVPIPAPQAVGDVPSIWPTPMCPDWTAWCISEPCSKQWRIILWLARWVGTTTTSTPLSTTTVSATSLWLSTVPGASAATAVAIFIASRLKTAHATTTPNCNTSHTATPMALPIATSCGCTPNPSHPLWQAARRPPCGSTLWVPMP